MIHTICSESLCLVSYYRLKERRYNPILTSFSHTLSLVDLHFFSFFLVTRLHAIHIPLLFARIDLHFFTFLSRDAYTRTLSLCSPLAGPALHICIKRCLHSFLTTTGSFIFRKTVFLPKSYRRCFFFFLYTRLLWFCGLARGSGLTS